MCGLVGIVYGQKERQWAIMDALREEFATINLAKDWITNRGTFLQKYRTGLKEQLESQSQGKR